MTDLRAAWSILARVAAAVWFRDVEVVGRDRLTGRGPAIVVASHFNGLLDPVLVADVAPRLPRFLAKSTLWRNPVVARMLDSADALPVYRPAEDTASRNKEMFEACYEALADGDMIAMFPEGTTHDRPQVSEVRTGAARIALGARQAGISGLRIVPVGLVYTAKASPRNRALVRVGEPIDLDDDLTAVGLSGAEIGPENPEAVRRLTEEIRTRLADAALDYEDADAALIAAQAAGVALRPVGAPLDWEPSLDGLERCARALAAAPPDALMRLIRAFLPYHDSLTILGLTDAHFVAGDLTPAELRWRVGRLVAAGAVAPAAAVGLAVNGPAVALVWAAGRLHLTAAMRGTARLLTGAASLLGTWTTLRWALARRGWREPTLAVLAAGPGCGLIALSVVERLRALRSARESVERLREHTTVIPTLWAQRGAVVDAVRHALRATGARDIALPAGPAGRGAADAPTEPAPGKELP